MSLYVFILGKNWLLSIAELIVRLDDRGVFEEIVDHSRTAAIVRTTSTLSGEELIDIQASLGGCFKIGHVVKQYDVKIARNAFPKQGRIRKNARLALRECNWVDNVWRRVSGKRIKFGVSSYPSIPSAPRIDLKRFTLGMDEWIKQKLVQMGAKKAVYYAYEEPDRRNASRPNTALWPATIARHNLLTPPNAEILAVFTETSLYLAKSRAVYDSQLQQFRDEARPYISAGISTSPKLCRTLLSLAGARAGDTVLDPFCGTGTLLMEAALLDMKCVGIDINPDVVQGAISNLKWLGHEMGQRFDFTILLGDARDADRIIPFDVDAIAFEPDLGPLYDSPPTRTAAEKQIRELTELYTSTLQALEKRLKPGGRISMTIPAINSDDGQVTLNLDQLVKNTDLSVQYLLPERAFHSEKITDDRLKISPNRLRIYERKRGQIVQREVIMLAKV